MYPVERQKQALSQLSTTLKAVVSQRLLPRCDIKGRIGMFEIMFVNSAIANLIRENKIPQIEQTIELNQGAGMITRKMSIDNLLASGIISPETAYEYSFDVGKMIYLKIDQSQRLHLHQICLQVEFLWVDSQMFRLHLEIPQIWVVVLLPS